MEKRDWTAVANELGRGFAERIAEHDANDSFVAENYVALKEQGMLAAGIPSELGGGGATLPEVCAMIRTLARHCSSTALALSMHTHLVATMTWNWRNGNKAPEAMLKRVAAEKLVLVSTGGSDWLDGSGKLVKVDGGYRLSGRKIFSSGVPVGDFLMTTGIYDDPENGKTVFHFPVSLKAEGVKILETWRTLGMRGTGSNDIELTDVFVPDAVMGGVRRPAGKWHPAVHVVAMVALPILYGAYVGVAEGARDLALRLAAKKRDDAAVQTLVGEMETHLLTAQLAHDSSVSLSSSSTPSAATSSAMVARRMLIANGVLRTVDKALEVAGGSCFYRAAGLERLFRDAQGVRFHPVQEKPGTKLVGRHLLGLELDA
jgi:alkylation response protein AidB-like acyl-CoA dehydrogenase